jgi:hypothetical protein
MARTLLAERVADQNRINALANEIEGHLLRLLSPWQQKKAFKTSGWGGMVAALQKAFDAYCESHGYNVPATDDARASEVWLNLYRQYTSVTATVSLRCNSGVKVDLYLGRTNDAGVLITEADGHKRRTDYTVAEIESAFARAYQLESEARELRSNYREFG